MKKPMLLCLHWKDNGWEMSRWDKMGLVQNKVEHDQESHSEARRGKGK